MSRFKPTLPRDRVHRSEFFQEILSAIKKNPNLNSKQLWERKIVKLDNSITLNQFQTFLRKFNKKTDIIAREIVQDVVDQKVKENLSKSDFFNLVDDLVKEKLEDPEARAKLTLSEALKVKVDSEKLKQKDEEISLKRNDDERKESLFDLLVDGVMGGTIEGETINSLELGDGS